MARLAFEADFNGSNADSMYSQYFHWPEFDARAQRFLQRFGGGAGAVLVAGCGAGYMVKALLDLGLNAFGIDASAWIVNRGIAEVPALSTRLVVADATTVAGMNSVKSLAGLQGNQRFRAGVSEDLLPCLTDAEAANLVTQMNRVCTAAFHIITCDHPELPDMNQHVTALNWKTQAQWKAIVGQDPCWDDQLQVVF